MKNMAAFTEGSTMKGGLFEIIEKNLIDKNNGEWFYKRDEDGSLVRDEFKISEWKGPYHNSRACLELVRRLDCLSRTQIT